MEKPEATNQEPRKQIFSEYKGEYVILNDKNICRFNFPAQNSLEDNLAAITFLRQQLIETIAKNEAEKAKEQAEEPKVEEAKP